MRYRLTTAAVTDLARIGRYSRSRWGERQARIYRDTLKARFHWLTENQSLWRRRADLGPGLYSCLEGRHVILFRASSESIEILRVLHSRMDLRRHLPPG